MMNKELEEELIRQVRENPIALGSIKEQTEAICMAAVKVRGYALGFVKNQTEKICLAGVKENGRSLSYVKNQTEAICLEAVKQDGYAYRYCEIITEDIAYEAISKNWEALEYLNLNDREECLAVVKAFSRRSKKDSETLTKIINKFSKDKILKDIYTKHNLWKYVNKFNDELLSYSMVN